MLRTLYAKMALILVVLLITVGLLYAVLSTSATRSYLQQVNQQFNSDLARNLVMDRNLVQEGRLNQAALKETFHQYMVINPSIEIYLLDMQGKILAYSADPGKVKRRHVALAPIEQFLRGEGSYPLLGDDPRSHDRRKAFSVTTVPSAESPEGYLYVVLRGEEFDSAEQMIEESHLLRLSGWAVLGSLAIALFVGLLLFFILTRRLHRLTTQMERFQLSNFTQHLAHSDGERGGGDEVDRLAETFDQMAERITAQLAELKEQDSLRRELVAQVSHDLRTPLAALRGYLESLKLKADSLSQAEREEYLIIALRQSERLTRRVDELFELAKLDAKETQPVCEAFALIELADDVMQKFQLQAQQAQITLQIEPAEGLPFVWADIALTERVLDNLLENALRHTSAGGHITLVLKRVDAAILITVVDSGSGIHPADLPHLFESFYRAKAQDNRQGHAGLGLAIAKRIVLLQGGEIGAESEQNVGSTFYFTLPILDGSHQK
ncbi:MAG: HAMP domain-containing histidine kinase [Candidatus Polarisedimenticolaceae bacterium]|nr:HAMP domain-containing histidine kinase [Candidatus Polarisedimenticolaceae bacterium]